MKSLVLLYRDKHKQDDLVIRFYSEIKERKNSYILGKSWYGTYYGIRKDFVGEVTHIKKYPCTYPVELPLSGYYDSDIVFLFVNGEKYNINPVHYQDMVLNYTSN